ncbi:hypothetical protein [Clostridium pasteurianum]|uniref:Uncharacterized protein n=1 Tax=Clostridium pasteurianum BC1 TaxID=86416 RepID=R4K7D2_CLOPA|nr:hypothetical protein [Clostridium pasteurianum]AGK99082.1 hypothetical protein Clopa_4370 [Clostridium pasteurianum BC1]
MNKKKLSIVVIMLAMVTVIIMLLTFSFSKGIDTEDNKTLILNNSKVENNPNIDTSNNIKKDSSQERVNSNKNSIKSSNVEVPKDEDSNKQVYQDSNYQNESKAGDIEKENVSRENDLSSYSSEEKNQLDDRSDISVFKVSKEKIASELTFSDKIKILSISKNLSSSDVSELKNDINNGNEKKGISDAMQLLKRKLNNKDFNNVENIASRFINLDSINN